MKASQLRDALIIYQRIGRATLLFSYSGFWDAIVVGLALFT